MIIDNFPFFYPRIGIGIGGILVERGMVDGSEMDEREGEGGRAGALYGRGGESRLRNEHSNFEGFVLECSIRGENRSFEFAEGAGAESLGLGFALANDFVARGNDFLGRFGALRDEASEEGGRDPPAAQIDAAVACAPDVGEFEGKRAKKDDGGELEADPKRVGARGGRDGAQTWTRGHFHTGAGTRS